MASLLFFYGNVFDRAALRQYQDSQSMFDELEYADVPDEVRDTISQYSALSSKLFTTLNNLESLLDEASILFAQGQNIRASEKLEAVEDAVLDVHLLWRELGTKSLGDGLGVFAAAADSPIRVAYSRLEEMLERLMGLISELEQLRQNLADDPEAVITAFYYPTFLEVLAPETAYPGLPIIISGQISATGGQVVHTLKVLLDSALLAEEVIENRFSLKVTLPAQAETGEHSLNLVVAPQERDAGTAKSLPINISRLPIEADVKVPALVFLPRQIELSGRVKYGLEPLGNAQVKLALKDSVVTLKTSSDGSFNTVIREPFGLSLVGPQELTVTVVPAEPWYDSLEIERWIFTMSPASIGLMLAAFAGLGLLLFRRLRTPLPRREEAVVPEGEREVPLTVSWTPGPGYELSGTRARILSAYLRGVAAVEKVTGAAMAPHITLREFLDAASSHLPRAAEPFAELTIITEHALYSMRKPGEDAATRAEQMATVILKELDSGVT